MRQQRISVPRGIAVVIFALAILQGPTSVAAGDVPESVGPQGFLIWEPPRNLPELAFEDKDGNPLTLADFQSKVILLNIWATWCAPCREEMPTLDSLQAQLGGEQFEVIALSVDHAGIRVVEKFYQETGVQHLRKYIGPSTLATSKLGIEGVPTTLLIDHDGREIGRLVGAAEWDSSAMVDLMTRAIDGVPD
ncbi:TlpA disulfide reductase family protein [Marinobacter alexandrii]|uniref:TlpA family protein disulfide reductase n=1 Tax=Marinobacter alexandrii TaxID=2570351 RepID=UPI002ABE64F2|nr:TlpA disulfide reductase family protein [Marinobacter alexandrii]